MDIKNWMIGDFHIHSRFSRACSKNIDFENLAKWAKIKGLNLLGTGDFTHPVWLEEIKKLKSNGKGFYYLNDFPFIITGEISLMYTQGRGRRIHLVLLVPSIEIAEKINSYLDTQGRRDYDGRPIFKLPGDEFVRKMMKISTEIEIIPAHIWTPWFGVFGSMSGFDSLKECFKEQFENVHAIETGISSDPEMNWRIKELENKAIVSFSDAHSFWPFRLGREATIFKKCDSFKEIIEQIRGNDFIGTIETEPAYGKYHWDGHRNCNFSCSPEKTKELNGICPVCKKPLTIGVDNRVEQLAENPIGFKAKNEKPFHKLLPLHEIISLCFGFNMQSKKVWDVYNNLIKEFENEFNILLNVSKEELLSENVDDKLANLIIKNRQQKIKVKPGYDGEYGEALLGEQQSTLFS
ncbi:DNA helicase UvrD [Candidatus Pacearchaeota archaeon]|nr:DNA helicase UvrD [Candidatus Pacearchaeota archaeon]